MSSLTKTVDFSRIRYANCWEDADVLLHALKLNKGSKILCIASGGDNALALLATNPEKIIAADLSAPQLYLTELKQQAIAALSYEEVLHLLGITDCGADVRLKLYRSFNASLSTSAGNYWNAHLHEIASGLIHAGKFERYFKVFRKWLLPLVHSEKIIAQLLAPKPDEAQQAFYNSKWNTWRWKVLMNIFFSKVIMGKYGRDPEFLRHVNIPVSAYIRRQAETHLQQAAATQNYFLHYILTGSFGSNLPFYLRRENFEAIRGNIHRLKLVQDDVCALIGTAHFDACCLSNIFEYMSAENFAALVPQFADSLGGGGKLAFWNLMAPRSFSETAPELFRRQPVTDIVDKGFFYSAFLAEERK